MTAPRPAPEPGQWSAEGHPLVIRWDPFVLDTIRDLVVDGFFRAPHGGIEVGGVLFGTHEGDTIAIRAFRPIGISYAEGPGFHVNAEDRKLVPAVLASPGREQELAGLVPVGWYRSRNRTAILLSERDLEFYDEFFPEPWQIALVLKPAKLAPARAGFFFREAGGRVHHEGTYREFELEPIERRRGGGIEEEQPEATPPAHTPQPVSRPVRLPYSGSERAHEPATRRSQRPSFANGPGRAEAPDSGRPAGNGSPWPASATPESPASLAQEPAVRKAEPGSHSPPVEVVPYRPRPEIPVYAARKRRPALRWMLAVVLLSLAGLGSYELYSRWDGLALLFSDRIDLKAVEDQGQLRIAWNRAATELENAANAQLIINDGGVRTTLELDPVQLRFGSVTYQRVSGDVEIRLRVDRPGSETVEEITRYLGSPVAAARAARAELSRAELSAVPAAASPPKPEAAAPLREPEPLAPRTQAAPLPAQESKPPASSRSERATAIGRPAPSQEPPATSTQPATRPAANFPKLQTRPQAQPTVAASVPASETGRPAGQPETPQRPRFTERVSAREEPEPRLIETPPPPGVSASPKPAASKPAPVEVAQIQAPPPASAPATQPPATPSRSEPAVTAPSAEAKPAAAGPRSGRAIWTGHLPRNATLVIASGKPSTGFLSGPWPSRGPVRLSVQPAELSGSRIVVYTANSRYARPGTVDEPPSLANGWNHMQYRYDPSRVADLNLLLAEEGRPHFAVKPTRRNLAVVVIDWEIVE